MVEVTVNYNNDEVVIDGFNHKIKSTKITHYNIKDAHKVRLILEDIFNVILASDIRLVVINEDRKFTVDEW